MSWLPPKRYKLRDAKLKIFNAKTDIYSMKDNGECQESTGNVVSQNCTNQDAPKILLP